MDNFDGIFDLFQWQNFDGNIYPGSEKEYQLSLWDHAQPNYPSMYEVVLVNNGNAPKEAILTVLHYCFRMTAQDSKRMLSQIQDSMKAICGMSTKEIAETKVFEVNDFVCQHQYPLTCVMQKSNNYAVKKS